MPASLNEEPVESQETFKAKTSLPNAICRVFNDDRLQRIQRTRLEIHMKTASLEKTQLQVGQQPIIVLVANFEHASESFLALVGELAGK